MIHYTLNTGHTAQAPRTAATKEVLERLYDLACGGGRIPGPYSSRVEIMHVAGAAMFTVSRKRAPLVTCGVAWTKHGAAEIWPALESLYLAIGDRRKLAAPGAVAKMPAAVPWLAEIRLPGPAATARNDLGWLGDFERYLAWTIIEAAP